MPVLHWGTWCSVLILSVSLLALYRLLGLSAFVGIGVVLVFWPLGTSSLVHWKRQGEVESIGRNLPPLL